MIHTFLQTLETLDLPHQWGKFFRHSYLQSRKRIYAYRTRIKKQALAWHKRQYYVTHALQDLKTAVHKNEDRVITSVITAIILMFAATVTITPLLIMFFSNTLEFANFTGLDVGMLVLILCSALLTLLGWYMALIMNMVSVSVMDGTIAQKHVSVRRTFSCSLRMAKRVAGAWLMLAGLLGIAVTCTLVAFYSYVVLAGKPVEMSINQLVHLASAAGVLMLAVLMHYSLAPHVALFEPNIKLIDTLKRSRQLVTRRGKYFLLASYLGLATSIGIIYFGAIWLEAVTDIPSLPFIFTLVFAALLLFNSLTVMLYRKRRLARKN